jgi:tRNA-dihydrouridine synthase
MMRAYYGMLLERTEKDTVGKMKQFATYFTHGVRGGAKLRAAIYHLGDGARILDAVDEFFLRRQESEEEAESGVPIPEPEVCGASLA